jgi:hypothetical protein
VAPGRAPLADIQIDETLQFALSHGSVVKDLPAPLFSEIPGCVDHLLGSVSSFGRAWGSSSCGATPTAGAGKISNILLISNICSIGNIFPIDNIFPISKIFSIGNI